MCVASCNACSFTLLDGTTVLIRPIEPEDKPLLVAGLRHSARRRALPPLPQSRRSRFSAAELRYLTEVDQPRPHRLRGASTGRPARSPSPACVRTGPDIADVAIVVGDPWQGQGLGRRLLRPARRARGRGGHHALRRHDAGRQPAARFRLMRGFGLPFERDESRTACAKSSLVWPRSAFGLKRRAGRTPILTWVSRHRSVSALLVDVPAGHAALVQRALDDAGCTFAVCRCRALRRSRRRCSGVRGRRCSTA